MVVAWHALTQRSKDQGHTVTKTFMVARLLVTCAATAMCCCWQRGSACRYDCLCFIVWFYGHDIVITKTMTFTFSVQSGRFVEDMIPTVGFNMRKVTKGNVTIKVCVI